MRKILIVTICLLFNLLFSQQSASISPFVGPIAANQVHSNIATRMDSLFQILHSKQSFNGNILLAQNGAIIYANCFGYSDINERHPLNIESVFEIGSITKQFTATAIMILYENGKLNFDDPVYYFFPKFPYKNITIHHLLTHRSGLPDYLRFAKRYWKNKSKLMTNNDLMNIMIVHRPALVFPPDKEYYYSNTGYVILACIVEKISGIKYADFLKKNIFDPLEMSNTFVLNKQRFKNTKHPTFGHNSNKRKVKEDFLCGTFGDKGIYSTVEDMLKWDQALYSELILKQETLQKAFTPFSYDKKNERNYGYGWRIIPLGDEQIVYHAGRWRGYCSLFIRRPATKSTLIILSNINDTSYEDIELLISTIDSSIQFPKNQFTE